MNPPRSPQSDPVDPLDALLREADVYIPDDGFTARVMAALPRRRRAGWRRLCVLACATLLGAALLAWQLPLPSFLSDLFAAGRRAAAAQALSLLVPVLVALAALGWGLYALVNEEA